MQGGVAREREHWSTPTATRRFGVAESMCCLHGDGAIANHRAVLTHGTLRGVCSQNDNMPHMQRCCHCSQTLLLGVTFPLPRVVIVRMVQWVVRRTRLQHGMWANCDRTCLSVSGNCTYVLYNVRSNLVGKKDEGRVGEGS